MNIKRFLSAPLIALAGLLGLLVLPAAAQAHHIAVVTASCGASSTVGWKVDFIGFSGTAKPTAHGTVKLDGAVVATFAAGRVDFSREPGKVSGSIAAAAGQAHVIKADFKWMSGSTWRTGTATKTSNVCPVPPNPALTIVKDGPSTRYVGEQATFSYRVQNTGNVILASPVVTDDKCAPVTRVPDAQNVFDPNDVWTYTCTTTITGAMGDQLVNVGKACASYSQTNVCATDDHTTIIPKPAISLVKSGAATANAGETFTYSFAARNDGNVHATLDDVVLTDERCQSTLVRVDDTDTSFDPGDVWNYTCTVVAPAGPAQVDNVAKVCGTHNHVGVPAASVCTEDTHTFTVPPATTTTAPEAGAVLPETIASGVARLRGPSGCVKQASRVSVSGRSIAAVAFHLDGKLVKNVTSARAVYRMTLRPGRFGFGRHKLIARVRFTTGSGTEARRLPLTFRRCAQDAVAPRFTG